MAKMTLPIASDQIGLRPSLPAQIPVNDELRQTLALLLGYHQGDRLLLACSPSGVLYSSAPRLADIFHWTATVPNEAKQGDNIVCTEVLCQAHPDNVGRVWVRTRQTATVNNAFPLDAGDSIGFSVECLAEVRSLIVANGDTLIIGYSL